MRITPISEYSNRRVHINGARSVQTSRTVQLGILSLDNPSLQDLQKRRHSPCRLDIKTKSALLLYEYLLKSVLGLDRCPTLNKSSLAGT